MLYFLTILLTISVVLLVPTAFFAKYVSKELGETREANKKLTLQRYEDLGKLTITQHENTTLNDQVLVLNSKLDGAHRSLELMLEREKGPVSHVKTEIGPAGVDYELTEKKDESS